MSKKIALNMSDNKMIRQLPNNKFASIPDAILTQIFPYLTSQNISQFHQSSSRFDPSKYKNNIMIKHLYEQKLITASSHNDSATNIYTFTKKDISNLIYKLNVIRQTLSEIEAVEKKKMRTDLILISIDIYFILLENLKKIIQSFFNYGYLSETEIEKFGSNDFVNLIENYTQIFIQIATTKTFDTKPYKTLFIVWDLLDASKIVCRLYSIYRDEFIKIRQQLLVQIGNFFNHDSLNRIESREYLNTLHFSDLLCLYYFVERNHYYNRRLFAELDIEIDTIYQNLIVSIIEKYLNDADVDNKKFWNFIHELIGAGYQNIKLILENFGLWNNQNNESLTISEISKKLESSKKSINFWMTFLVEILLYFPNTEFQRLFPFTNFEKFFLEIKGTITVEMVVDPFLNLDIISDDLISIFQSIYQNKYDVRCDTVDECEAKFSNIQDILKYLQSFSEDIFFYSTIKRSINILQSLKKQILKIKSELLEPLIDYEIPYIET